MKAATRLTSKGQVVIPKAIRTRRRWRAGTRLEVEELPDGAVRLSAEAEDPIEEAFGCLTEGDALAGLEAEHRAEVKADEGRRRGRR